MKVAIVGGGIAGLATAWRLTRSGVDVTVLERDLVGRGATWAAAGMLASAAETGTGDDPIAQLAREARAAWPEFAETLQDASGRQIGFRRTGALMPALDDAKANTFKNLAIALRSTGEDASWLSPEEARRHEPRLTDDLHGALYCPDDAQVCNRTLGRALADAVMRAGGTVREQCAVNAVRVDAGRASGVITRDGTVTADVVVLAPGVWMNAIDGVPPEMLPAIRPAKGQMMAFQPPPGVSLPRPRIVGDDVYLVPHEPLLFVGASVEDAGFDRSVTRTEIATLSAAAARLMPSLETWNLSESWAGLRPRPEDDVPAVGPSGIDGLFLAGGLFRNGILFGPVIAGILAALIAGEEPGVLARQLDPARLRNGMRRAVDSDPMP